VTPRLYKAAEVCEIAGLQPYVLRSWEKEFPGIGVQKTQESARLYRQSDLDQVVRIKQLVFAEGLTLAGARRRLGEAVSAPASAGDDEMAEVLDTLGADARARISAVRNGLRSLLDALSKAPGSVEIAELDPIAWRPNGGSDRRGGPSASAKATADRRSAEREGRSGPPERRRPKSRSAAARRPAAATKRGATPKRTAPSGKSARGAKRKRAGA
jgi:DNA-binding transcriptional MerR regulator